jgi:hypothetical protein
MVQQQQIKTAANAREKHTQTPSAKTQTGKREKKTTAASSQALN